MRININEIKINTDRREASPFDIRKLADSIAEIGLMNPLTVDADHNLIAGLHRLEAAKLLEWTEIECTVNDLDSLHAELAEIDENYVRVNLTPLETSKLMLRRKEIYETLHPETKAGAAQGNGMKRSAEGGQLTDNLSARSKSFAQDTAEKLGVDERTVRRQVKIAKGLTPEAQKIIEESGVPVTQQNLDKLSRLEPEQQKVAAEKLVSGQITSIDEYSSDAKKTSKRKQKSSNTFIEDFAHFFERTEDWINHYYDIYETEFLFLSEEEVEAFEQKMLTLQVAMNKLLEKVKYCFNHAEELLKKIEEEEAAEEAQSKEEQNE